MPATNTPTPLRHSTLHRQMRGWLRTFAFGATTLGAVACGGSMAHEARPSTGVAGYPQSAPAEAVASEEPGAGYDMEADGATIAPAPTVSEDVDSPMAQPSPAPPAAEPAERAARGATLARPSRPHRRPPVRATGSVKAGEWDDNANWREFNAYLGSQSHLPITRVNVSQRRFIVVRDANGKPVPNCTVEVQDGRQKKVAITTSSHGRALLFPRAEGLGGDQLTASTSCSGGQASKRFDLGRQDGVVDLELATTRQLGPKVVDVAFILDTTGSMSEEIEAVKQTIRRATETLNGLGAGVRIALVEYKDNSDAFVTKVYGFSTDLQGFAQRVDGLNASGGGDTPENANRGLKVALSQLQWSKRSVARMAFLIGDAPPHLDYQDETSYVTSMRSANHRAIQLYTIAASGMDATGQAVWRQIAQYTGATNMFVKRGGAGPASTGGGDPTSSCGGTHTNYRSGNLHELVTSKIKRSVEALDGDPMRIAGLRQDENAKPCKDRLVLAQ